MTIVITVKWIVIMPAPVHRLDRDRAGDISAEHGHEIELPFGLYASLLREIGPQAPFGQRLHLGVIRDSGCLIDASQDEAPKQRNATGSGSNRTLQPEKRTAFPRASPIPRR